MNGKEFEEAVARLCALSDKPDRDVRYSLTFLLGKAEPVMRVRPETIQRMAEVSGNTSD